MLINASCTIYRKVFDPISMLDDEVRVYIPYCAWFDIYATSKIKNGAENADVGQIIIPYKQNIDSGMTFVKPIAYKNLVDKTGYWSVNNGDTIVKGEIPENVSFADLENLYDDVLKVTSVGASLFGDIDMQNIEVGGR